MTEFYKEYAADDAAEAYSPYGYAVLPDGRILALSQMQCHGQAVFEFFGDAAQTAVPREPDQTERERNTSADIWACQEHGWIRISIAPYGYGLSLGWAATCSLPTAQRESLKVLAMQHDFYEPDAPAAWATFGEFEGWDALMHLFERHRGGPAPDDTGINNDDTDVFN